ncbi:MAG: ATP synthase F1 subunit delta [Bacteroidales bacterium]|nr:ATP synthase F1 subunit delta [Bacteroidales bacterium]
MEDYRINTNYAKALFLVASDMGQLDAVGEDMRLVNSVCIENHMLNTVFANPFIREGKKVAILNELFGAHVSKVTSLFLAFVVKKRRAVNLRGISDAFIGLYRAYKNVVLSHFVTATEADDEAKQAVCRLVCEYTGKEVELQTEVDPDILGGFSIEFDNNMYDARLNTAINKLRKEFSKNVYESKL